jgi:hypothetical protein
MGDFDTVLQGKNLPRNQRYSAPNPQMPMRRLPVNTPRIAPAIPPFPKMPSMAIQTALGMLT